MNCVLTYDHPHSKTQDLLFILKLKRYEVSVVAPPWVERKSAKPLFKHKPDTEWHIKDVCRALGYSYTVTNDLFSYFSKAKPELILIGASGLLPKNIIENFTVINSHPGYLPHCRGLDALKWSLYEDIQIGVTTHVIDQDVDMGKLIRREKTPIKPGDTFDAIARRHYELEVKLLADAIEDIKNVPLTQLSGSESRIHKRMPNSLELEMKKKVDILRYNHSLNIRGHRSV